jgi:uncharacterized protein
VTPEALFAAVREALVDSVRPSRIVAFGSRVRGDARPDSDLDLIVVADIDGSLGKRTGAVRRHLRGLGMPIDVFVYKQEEYERLLVWSSSLPAIAEREGLVIYDRAA